MLTTSSLNGSPCSGWEIYLGLVVRNPEAVTAVQILVWPLGFLANAFVAPSTMPGWLGAVAEWNPLSATISATRELFGNPGWEMVRRFQHAVSGELPVFLLSLKAAGTGLNLTRAAARRGNCSPRPTGSPSMTGMPERNPVAALGTLLDQGRWTKDDARPRMMSHSRWTARPARGHTQLPVSRWAEATGTQEGSRMTADTTVERAHTVADSPVGQLTFVAVDGKLCGLYMDQQRHRPAQETFGAQDAELFTEARRQMEEYFAGQRTEFDLPMVFLGTPFQQRVWSALCEIPFGETTTYGELAERIGRPTASRAVGAANGRNPIGIIVPCHRVVGSDGKLVGYGGGVDRKRHLLDFERSVLASNPATPCTHDGRAGFTSSGIR